MTTSNADRSKMPEPADMFVTVVTMAIDLAHLLQMSREDFVNTLQQGWDIDQQRRTEQLDNDKENVKS